MDRETIDLILQYLKHSRINTIDITGGAPELHPDFRYIVSEARNLEVKVIDRCNLTILLESGQETLARFLAENQVEVIASLPCYQQENVDQQRGKGVFDKSIQALKKLNELGYGKQDSDLVINLVYNPQGAALPPGQVALEKLYKQELSQRYNIEFNQLFVLCNMPINRFGSTLISKGQFHDYMNLLKGAHQDENLDDVMCRSLISVDWKGYIYDCDFNQMLGLDMRVNGSSRTHISDLLHHDLKNMPIVVRDHCFGCTAGQGSSCGGALST